MDDSGAAFDDSGGQQCVPCYEECACQAGSSYFALSACATYTCPASGKWGPFKCTGVGCPPEAGTEGGGKAHDAAVDGEAGGDAASDAPAGDGGSEASDGAGDAPADAPAGG